MSNEANSGTAARAHQMFPVLTADQIDVARRFASARARHFAPGETVYSTGQRDVPVWLLLEGTIDVQRRDGLDGDAPITTHDAGQFTGEVNQLDGRGSIASARAGASGCLALPFDRPHLRALMIGSAEVGEIVMRALILRRVGLIEQGGSGTILIGAPDDPVLLRLQGFLLRAGYPNLVIDSTRDEKGRSLVEQLALVPDDLPLVVCPGGAMLKRPDDRELAACLGIIPTLSGTKIYDVAVVGAGPAGLAAAVYGASEGLSMLVLDARAMGGQAGASARIENYLGFPTGISGQALAARAFDQALKFGADVAIPVQVDRLETDGELRLLRLSNGDTVRARAVVIASGAAYRRPAVANLDAYEGAAVSYWASPVEGRLCAGKDVGLVGGGNSAGQAIVFLAPRVRELHVFVRRPLAETMSRYLIERIEALDNVTIHVGAELVGLEGPVPMLEGVVVHDGASGREVRHALSHLFLFIGATPHTAWLGDRVATDESGFVRTGDGAAPLETSLSRVFAIGDVRLGSTKRVAAAVGEGAAVIAQIHAMLNAATASPELLASVR
ncbi:FAD-dependent oxidoreductase [Sphingomonas sp. RS6]